MDDAIMLDLKRDFNWKAVSWLEKGIQVSMEHEGYSLAGEVLPNNEQIQCEGIPFHFPATDSLEEDVISCVGQQIEINNSKCASRIAVLGLSVFGSYLEEIQLEFADGTSAVYDLSISDWYQYFDEPKPLFGEQVGYLAPYHLEKSERISRPVVIWMQTVTLEQNQAIHRIGLPDNAYMFIFAITIL